MKRKLLIVALAFGTLGGFAAGCGSMCMHHRHHQRHGFKQFVTDVCTDAVRNAQQ